MKRKIVPCLILFALLGVIGCAEEVVPTNESLDTEMQIELEDERSTDIENDPEGKDPDVG